MPTSPFDRLAPRLAIALLCLYAPYAWLVLISYPWNSYRLLWIKMWPVLPGLPLLLTPAVRQLQDWAQFWVMGLVTVSILLGIVAFLLSKSRRTATVTLIVAGLCSSLNSILAYGLFRS
jgi:hypothetical protein